MTLSARVKQVMFGRGKNECEMNKKQTNKQAGKPCKTAVSLLNIHIRCFCRRGRVCLSSLIYPLKPRLYSFVLAQFET